MIFYKDVKSKGSPFDVFAHEKIVTLRELFHLQYQSAMACGSMPPLLLVLWSFGKIEACPQDDNHS